MHRHARDVTLPKYPPDTPSSYCTDETFQSLRYPNDMLLCEDSSNQHMMDVVLEMGHSNATPNSDFFELMQGNETFQQVDWPRGQMSNKLSANSSLEEEACLDVVLELNKRINSLWIRLKTSQKNTGLEAERRDVILREVSRCSEELFLVLQRLNREIEQSQLRPTNTSHHTHEVRGCNITPSYDAAFTLVESTPLLMHTWTSCDGNEPSLQFMSSSFSHSMPHSAMTSLCLDCYRRLIEIYEADVDWLSKHVTNLLQWTDTVKPEMPADLAMSGRGISIDVPLHLHISMYLVGRLQKEIRFYQENFLISHIDFSHDESGAMVADCDQRLARVALKALGEREHNLQKKMRRLRTIFDSSPVF